MRALLCFALLASAPLVAAGEKSRLPPNPAYRAECGSCHVPFPPRLLPEASWRQIVARLERHFGADASLDAKATQEIERYLAMHGGRRSSPEGDEPRITRTRWFLKEHSGEIPPNTNPADCTACHRRANEGYYDH